VWSLPYAPLLKSCPRIGSERNRLPVAAKIALVTAGSTGRETDLLSSRTRVSSRRALGEHRCLVTGLWSEQAVGIVGGEPKARSRN